MNYANLFFGKNNIYTLKSIIIACVAMVCCASSLHSQSISQLLDIEGKVIRLQEDRDIIRLEDGTTYILISTGENQVKINGEWYTGRNLTEDEYEYYDVVNSNFFWLVKLLPDFTVDKYISFSGIGAADITQSRDKLYFGFTSTQVITVNDDLLTLNDDTSGTIFTLDLDLNYEGVLLENDLRFLSFDSSEDYLVMQFWMTGDDTEEYGYFGLDTLYDFDYDEIWHQPSLVLVIYDLNAEQITHNWIYGSQGLNDGRKINLTQDETIYTMFSAGAVVHYTPTDIDTVGSWQQKAARYSIEGDLLWRTQPVAKHDNFHYSSYNESSNGDYYLNINPTALDTSFILNDTIVYESNGRPQSILKYNYEGESLWSYTPRLAEGNCDLGSFDIADDIVSAVYNCTTMDSLMILDSTYTNMNGGSVIFNLDAISGQVLSSYFLDPHQESNRNIVRFLSHDYENDKVYLGIESLSSKFDLFGTTLGHLDDSHIYFIELDMNFLVSTDDLLIDNTLMRAYPNPVNTERLLTIETATAEAGTYKLYGAQGRLIQSGTKPSGTKNHIVEIKNNNPGVYLLQYQESQKIQNQILIIN